MRLLPDITTLADLEPLSTDRARLVPALQYLARRHHLATESLAIYPRGANVVASLGDRVLKLYPPPLLGQHDTEALVLPRVSGRLPVATPELVAQGELDGWRYLVLSRIRGLVLEDVWGMLAPAEAAGLMLELGRIAHAAHAIDARGLDAIAIDWPLFLERQRSGCVARHRRHRVPNALIADIEPYLERTWPRLLETSDPVLLTGEYTPPNILVEETGGRWTITGIIDFADCMVGDRDYDLLGPTTFLTAGKPDLLCAFLAGYGRPLRSLDDGLRARLMGLLLLHRFSCLEVQLALPGWRDAQDLEALAQRAWPPLAHG